MTVTELINDLRQYLSDVNEPYLWDDSELLTYIKDTLQDIYQTVYWYHTTETISTVPGTYIYTLSGIPIKVFSNTMQLDFFYYDVVTTLIAKNIQGQPSMFSARDRDIYLYPIPDQIYTLIAVIRPTSSSLTYESEVSFPDIELVKLGALSRAYLKQDSETFDENSFKKLKTEYIDKLMKFKGQYIRNTNELFPSKIIEGLL